MSWPVKSRRGERWCLVRSDVRGRRRDRVARVQRGPDVGRRARHPLLPRERVREVVGSADPLLRHAPRAGVAADGPVVRAPDALGGGAGGGVVAVVQRAADGLRGTARPAIVAGVDLAADPFRGRAVAVGAAGIRLLPDGLGGAAGGLPRRVRSGEREGQGSEQREAHQGL
jgi:hypothetical protein